MANSKHQRSNERLNDSHPDESKRRGISRRGLLAGGTIAGVSGLLGVAAIQGSTQETQPSEGTPSATPQATPSASPVATPALDEDATEFTIVMGKPSELDFDPDELTIPANTDITLHLPNEGLMAHDFHIRELAVSTPLVEADDSITITINAANPGEYEFYCNVDGHREAGMVGTLIVE